MHFSRLFAGLIVVSVVAVAAMLIRQNNSADQEGRIDISAAQSLVGEKVSSTLPAGENPDAGTEPKLQTASSNGVDQVASLMTGATAKPSFAEADPRVSVKKGKADPGAPRFDVVRIDASGTAIIAGRGRPGTDVDILIGNQLAATVSVEKTGAFAAILQTPVEAGLQNISLRTKIGARDVRGPEEVTVLIPERTAEKKPLVVLTQPDLASRVVQRPEPTGGGKGFSIDVIDYNENGRIILSGSASSLAWVRIHLDGRELGRVRALASGLWSLTSPTDVVPGRYTIDLEEWDGADRMIQRISIPFERANLDELVIANGEMIVQPGHNLWTIAKSNYGSGIKYTVIYTANAGKISDPDLIYPGQVLQLPNN